MVCKNYQCATGNLFDVLCSDLASYLSINDDAAKICQHEAQKFFLPRSIVRTSSIPVLPFSLSRHRGRERGKENLLRNSFYLALSFLSLIFARLSLSFSPFRGSKRGERNRGKGGGSMHAAVSQEGRPLNANTAWRMKVCTTHMYGAKDRIGLAYLYSHGTIDCRTFFRANIRQLQSRVERAFLLLWIEQGLFGRERGIEGIDPQRIK